MIVFCSYAQVAQSVEQRTENPRVDGSIPPLGTMNSKGSDLIGAFFMPDDFVLRCYSCQQPVKQRGKMAS